MNSPHGRRGAICAHFGWTYDYLLNGIAWGLVQRMMIDAPGYDYEGDNGDDSLYLTEDNGDDVLRYLNGIK